MKELDNINADKFYTDLVINGVLIEESVGGSNEDDFKTFYGFDDAIDEADYEGYTLNEYGEAIYYKDGEVYSCSVYLENNEGVGINQFDKNEIRSLISNIIKNEPYDGDKNSFLEDHNWAAQFLK